MTNVNEKLDDLFDVIDDLFLEGEFRKADTLLYSMKNLDDFSLLIGILTVSAPARSKLPSRKLLFNNTKEIAIKLNRIKALDNLE